jgi:hypothetical protein
MTPQTPLWYSTIGSVTGITFRIGHTVLFAPCEQDILLLVDNPTALTITAAVPNLFAGFLREQVLEPRLRRLGGGV